MRGTTLLLFQMLIAFGDFIFQVDHQLAALMGSSGIFGDDLRRPGFLGANYIGLFLDSLELLLIGIGVLQGDDVDALADLDILLDGILDFVKDKGLGLSAIALALGETTHFRFLRLI